MSDATEQQPKAARIKVRERQVLSEQWARLERVTFDYLRTEGVWQSQTREIYSRGHGSAVLLYCMEQRSVVLTKQFRFPAWEISGDGFLLEVPAGIIESDNPAATIVKEVAEETGYIIEKPQFLFKAYATPGSVTEQLHYFCAPYKPENRSGTGGGVVAEGEDIEVLEVDIDEAMRWIRDGTIIDAKTIILLQHAMLNYF